MDHPIQELLSATMAQIRSSLDANTIIGTPIQAGEITLIPVSKLSFGFGTGGGDFAAKGGKASVGSNFGGGAGAGAKLDPVAFLVIRGDSVKLIPVTPTLNSVDRIIEAIPVMMDKVTDFIDNQQEKKEKKSDIAE